MPRNGFAGSKRAGGVRCRACLCIGYAWLPVCRLFCPREAGVTSVSQRLWLVMSVRTYLGRVHRGGMRPTGAVIPVLFRGRVPQGSADQLFSDRDSGGEVFECTQLRVCRCKKLRQKRVVSIRMRDRREGMRGVSSFYRRVSCGKILELVFCSGCEFFLVNQGNFHRKYCVK